MKKTFFLMSLLFTSLFPVMPAIANPQAQQCLNKLLTKPEERPDAAELLLTVEHEGSYYHVIRESYNTPRTPDARVYIRTDDQGGCQKLMSYLGASYPPVEVYEEKLGREVFQKIRAGFYSQK